MNDDEIRKELNIYLDEGMTVESTQWLMLYMTNAILNLNETLKNFALMYIAHVNDENIKLDRCIYDLERIIEEGMKTR